MRDPGFEALADGVLLFLVLLVATGIVLAGRPLADDRRSAGIQYAEDTRLALFRTTVDGLSYKFGGDAVAISNGTTVEDFLRIQVHLRARNESAYDFSAANAQVHVIAAALLRPGWAFAVLGGTSEVPDLVRIPSETILPSNHYASAWDYPSLDGGPGTTRLTVAVWLSPPR